MIITYLQKYGNEQISKKLRNKFLYIKERKMVNFRAFL